MISSQGYHPYVSSGHSTSVSFGKGKGVDEEINKKALKGERTVKKVISLTQIPLCTFFCSSMSTFWFPHEVLILSQQAIKKHIQETAYQCI